MPHPQRFLIFNNGMIGNTLFNMPVAQWLKQNVKNCFVGMVVDKIGLQLVGSDPNVDEFYTFNKKQDAFSDQLRLVMALRKQKYDVSLHLRKGVRNELLARFGGVKKRAGYRLKGSPQHLHVKLDEDTAVHRLESRAILMRETLDRDVTLERPRLYPVDKAEREVDNLLADAYTRRKDYFVLHPTGDSQGGIGWSLPTYAQAVRDLAETAPVYVICMPGERERVEKTIPSGKRVHYYTGSIATTSALIRGAGAFIGNDSGPAHIACAWDVPRLVVYRNDDGNYTKWQPIDMTGCSILFKDDFTASAVVDAALKLRHD